MQNTYAKEDNNICRDIFGFDLEYMYIYILAKQPPPAAFASPSGKVGTKNPTQKTHPYNLQKTHSKNE